MDTVRSSDGTTIAFDRTGNGPPLIVVGGSLSTRSAAADLAAQLGSSLTVVAFDRRGRGDSTDHPPYSPQREIEDIDALIRVVGGSAFVFGHSSGAALAIQAAAAGLEIQRLAVYEPPFIVDDAREPLTSDYVAHVEELVEAGRRGDAVEYFLITGPQIPREVVEQMRTSPMWPAMEAMAHTIVYDNRVMGDAMGGSPTPLRRWASISAPTLVLDGGASPAWIRNAARTLADTLPNAEYRTLAEQTHGPPASVLAPVLAAFFSGT